MEKYEFKKKLGEVESSVYKAVLYYTVWSAIWPKEETLQVNSKYRDFFGPVRGSLFEIMLVHLSEVLDTATSQSSLVTLLQTALQDPQTMAPLTDSNEISEMLSQTEKDLTTLEKLKKVKDQHLTNFDARPLEDQTVRKGEVDNLAKSVQTNFSRLFFVHDGSRHTWSPHIQYSDWTTTAMINVLSNSLKSP